MSTPQLKRAYLAGRLTNVRDHKQAGFLANQRRWFEEDAKEWREHFDAAMGRNRPSFTESAETMLIGMTAFIRSLKEGGLGTWIQEHIDLTKTVGESG